MNVLVLDDGETLRGYDCREVLGVEEMPEGAPSRERFVVRLGRTGGDRREIRCREVIGFFPLSPHDVRPLPAALRDRMTTAEEEPWAVGITAGGLCLLY